MVTLTGCGKSRSEIEDFFEYYTKLYPTENLMDFYNMEGDRSDGFEENDLGTWIISNSIITRENGGLKSEGMVLYFNINTKEATGYYYIRIYSSSNEEIRYPVYYDEKGIHLVKDIEDDNLKDKILNFRFLIQDIPLDRSYLGSLKVKDSTYNSEMPRYDIQYKLIENDPTIKKIRELYPNLNIGDEPHIDIEGSGDSKFTKTGKGNMDIYLQDNVYISESISWTSDKVGDLKSILQNK